MLKTGVAHLPLHHGKAPRWLFRRMATLGGIIAEMIVSEYGQQEFLRRISDPFFFQSYANVLGFDWHSSGTTPVLCGALKESLNKANLGIRVAGGKGHHSRKTPDELSRFSHYYNFSSSKEGRVVYSSKMTAKVDNALVQDGYSLYHHCFFLTEKGDWAVVQQGMNPANRYARRYHWLSGTFGSFVEEPHASIASPRHEDGVLDMTSPENGTAREHSLDVLRQDSDYLNRHIMEKTPGPGQQRTLGEFYPCFRELAHGPDHLIAGMHRRNIETLRKAQEMRPKSYEGLVALPGVGAKTIRSLALIAQVVHGTELHWKDPVRYTFAHGGKDGIPYPVDRKTYDRSIGILRNALDSPKIGREEKMKALRRLSARC